MFYELGNTLNMFLRLEDTYNVFWWAQLNVIKTLFFFTSLHRIPLIKAHPCIIKPTKSHEQHQLHSNEVSLSHLHSHRLLCVCYRWLLLWFTQTLPMLLYSSRSPLTSVGDVSCIPREVRARHKPLAEAQRERFNCSACHAEIIQRAADSQMVVCNKSCLFTRVVCYSAYCLLQLIVFDE